MALKSIKVGFLKHCKRMGILSAVGRSSWRTRRLLILGYHGVSQDAAHMWNPAVYMSPDAVRHGMELLIRSVCRVLPLAEALARLARNDLPPRAITITFDA